MLAARGHRNLDREVRVGVLTGGTRFPNIIDLHVFWLNERCRRSRFSINPDTRDVDVLWVYSQDPLTDKARSEIDDAIKAAPCGTVVVNRPEAYDFYHRTDAFQILEARSVPVPRSSFGEADIGIPVLWKAEGVQSRLIGPQPYRGPLPGHRPFEFIDVREPTGLYCRYRAVYIFGEVYCGSAFRSGQPIVRYKNAVALDQDWRITADELHHVETIAEVSGLDCFAVDFVRRPDTGQPVFTDINVFPMFKDIEQRPNCFGHRHDFDKLRPVSRGPSSVWEKVDQAMAGVAHRPRVPPAVTRAGAP
jgi:hypothetical protein